MELLLQQLAVDICYLGLPSLQTSIGLSRQKPLFTYAASVLLLNIEVKYDSWVDIVNAFRARYQLLLLTPDSTRLRETLVLFSSLGCQSMLTELISLGAEIDQSCLSRAVRNGHLETANLLLAAQSIFEGDLSPAQFQRNFEDAILGGWTAIVESFAAYPHLDLNKGLLVAVRHNQLAAVVVLLDSGATDVGSAIVEAQARGKSEILEYFRRRLGDTAVGHTGPRKRISPLMLEHISKSI